MKTLLQIFQIEIGTWGLNKTVGWAWDLSSLGFLFNLLLLVVFLISYLILLLFKIRFNKTLGFIQIAIILFIGFTSPFQQFPNFNAALNVISVLLLIINIFLSIAKKRKQKSNLTCS
jgi:hypothetical protein